MIPIAAALLAFGATPSPPPELLAASAAYSDCVEQLWPQAEAGVRPADAAASILDYCRPQRLAWVSGTLRWLDSRRAADPSAANTRQIEAERRRILNSERSERARLITLISRARRQNRGN